MVRLGFWHPEPLSEKNFSVSCLLNGQIFLLQWESQCTQRKKLLPWNSAAGECWNSRRQSSACSV
jgi:hypothetical protein